VTVKWISGAALFALGLGVAAALLSGLELDLASSWSCALLRAFRPGFGNDYHSGLAVARRSRLGGWMVCAAVWLPAGGWRLAAGWGRTADGRSRELGRGERGAGAGRISRPWVAPFWGPSVVGHAGPANIALSSISAFDPNRDRDGGECVGLAGRPALGTVRRCGFARRPPTTAK
jgi:hypothetical protein